MQGIEMPAGGHSDDFTSDTPIQNFEYCGWIPCLTGHLEFSLMRVRLAGEQIPDFSKLRSFIPSRLLPHRLAWYDSVTDTYNYSYKDHPKRHHRRVALQSWYNWQDEKKDKDGKFRIIVVAETNESPDPNCRGMQGFLCIYPRAYAKGTSTAQYQGNRCVMDVFGQMRQEDKTYPQMDASDPDSTALKAYQNAMNEHWVKLYNLMSSGHPLGKAPDLSEVYIIKFRIQCNGMTFLSYMNSEEEPERSTEHRFIVARQAYYYIKYALHKHKHHGHDADTLTTIVPIHVGNSSHIAQILILQLKRALVQTKRIDLTNQSKHNTSTEALGIIAYARALLTTCQNQFGLDDERAKQESAHLDALSLSYETNNKAYLQKQQNIDSIRQTARQWTTITMAYISLSCLILINLFPGDRDERSLLIIERITALGTSYLATIFIGGAIVIYLFTRTMTWLNHPYRHSLSFYSGKVFTKRQVAILTGVLLVAWLANILWITPSN